MSQRETKVYDFYCCYLLRSVPKPRSFYIGSTPDPVRRLRQHNGALSAGAYKTKRNGFRPWKAGMIVYGFPSKISALMFEHAWQHPYATRHIDVQDRITKKKGSGNGMAHRVGNVRLLLNSNFFQKLGLKVQIFDAEIYDVWTANRFKIKTLSEEVVVEFSPNSREEEEEVAMVEGGNYNGVAAFVNRLKAQSEELFDGVKRHILETDEYRCSKCETPLYLESDMVGVCYHCFSFNHIRCMVEARDDLIPVAIECDKCGLHLKWTIVVRISNYINSWMTSSTAN